MTARYVWYLHRRAASRFVTAARRIGCYASMDVVDERRMTFRVVTSYGGLAPRSGGAA